MSDRTASAAPLRKCIATVALSGSLPDKLEAAATVGFDGVEIMEADLLTFDGSPADATKALEFAPTMSTTTAASSGEGFSSRCGTCGGTQT